MKGHRYRITVEHLATAGEGQPLHDAPLTFEAVNHDDLFAIVERVRASSGLEQAQAEALVIGLKLFSEVALRHRSEPLFEGTVDALGQFIGRLKARAPAA